MTLTVRPQNDWRRYVQGVRWIALHFHAGRGNAVHSGWFFWFSAMLFGVGVCAEGGSDNWLDCFRAKAETNFAIDRLTGEWAPK